MEVGMRKFGNKKEFFFSASLEKKTAMFIYSHIMTIGSRSSTFSFFVYHHKKKVPETHKIANAKWKRENLGVCRNVMVILLVVPRDFKKMCMK